MPSRSTWSRFSDKRLLTLRICDLGLKLNESPLAKPLKQLADELAARAIKFRPHVWLSDEWFAKDGVPGFAVPFYLADTRLTELERSQMLDVEAGTHDWCMRILRHETGHAIDTAYRLHRRHAYRELFGSYTRPYPTSYRPRAASRDYVLHLDLWYAQSHPAEDFAETFAVWLDPASQWKRSYKGWGAMEKLKYVDELMQRIGRRKPTVPAGEPYRPISEMKHTLRRHYSQKRRNYEPSYPSIPDRDLRRLFSATARGSLAAEFLSERRDHLRMLVSRWTGETQFTLDRTLADLDRRLVLQKLRLKKSRRETETDLLLMLTLHTMNFLHDAEHRIVL